eukprot:SAG11_NODE_298_length_11076_cov_4.253621_13_plen_218_part_00
MKTQTTHHTLHPTSLTGERFNCFDADDAQGSLRYIMFERYRSLKDATLKQMASRMPTPPDNVWPQPSDLTDEEQVLANKMGQDGKKLLKQDEGLSKMQASNLTIAKPILRTLNLVGSNWNAAEQVRDLLGELKTVTSASLSADNAANAKISERIDILMQQIIAREQDSIEIGSGSPAGRPLLRRLDLRRTTPDVPPAAAAAGRGARSGRPPPFQALC